MVLLHLGDLLAPTITIIGLAADIRGVGGPTNQGLPVA